MVVLPPGVILQLMYLQERLQSIQPGRFVEIGPGSGEITRLLLENGWVGSSYDIEEKTINALKLRFEKEIKDNRYKPINEDYLSSHAKQEMKVDLVISCMVMEHLSEDAQISYMNISKEHLNQNGIMIGLVPASPSHWGIEDDIAGHLRRYTRVTIKELLDKVGWDVLWVAGLTFPVANILLPISNFLVNKNERSKLKLSNLERTKQSGRRVVNFKTHFPSVLRWVLNKYSLFPLHVLQKIFVNSEKAIVLYFEAKPCRKTVDNGKTFK